MKRKQQNRNDRRQAEKNLLDKLRELDTEMLEDASGGGLANRCCTSRSIN